MRSSVLVMFPPCWAFRPRFRRFLTGVLRAFPGRAWPRNGGRQYRIIGAGFPGKRWTCAYLRFWKAAPVIPAPPSLARPRSVRYICGIGFQRVAIRR